MSQLQIPFLYAPFKETDEVDWIRPLKRHISQVYQQNPDDYKEETYTIHRLRQDIRGAGKDLTGRDLLYRYFGQLELLDLRFPIDEKHIRVLFTWYDAFNETSTSQYSLAFEKACIIFNIAATLSAIAASQNRADADGRKRAYNFFQASAGMFQYINDNFLHAPSKDLHKDTIQLLINLMLVQAQECFLENSLREKKKDALIAKLASHTTWTYGNLIDQINEAISSRGLKLDPTWLVLCQVKQKYYQALAQVHRSQACYINHQYGEQVARLAWAEKLAKEGEKLATQLASLSKTSSSATTASILISYIGKTNQDATTTTATTTTTTAAGNDHTTTKNADNKEYAYGCFVDICRTLQASCLEKLTTAERDNDLIYHDQVPQESILVPIDRLKAVKAVPIHELYSSADASKVIGPDIFQRLIPLSIHEASSLYSEEKAALIRRETERCDVAKAEYSAALDYMKLPHGLHKFKSVQKSDASITTSILNTFASPPSQVNQWANEIKANESAGSATTIQALIDQLQRASQETKATLDHISLQLDKEMGACESMRVKYGNDWLQDPSGVLTKNYRQDLRTHIETLTNAQASDQQIIQKYHLISNELAILKQGADSQALETLFTDSLSFNEQLSPSHHQENTMLDLQIDVGLGNKTMEQKVNKIEAILNKLDTLQKDRGEILADLKDKTMKDDITQILVLNKKNTNAEQQIFTTQLGKYQSHQQQISTSIYQQQQTIQELGTAFKQLMELDEARKLQSRWDTAERQHHQVVKKLNTTFTDYQYIKETIKNGIVFYQQLADVVQSLEKNVDHFVNQRKTEREELADAIEQSRSHHEQELLKQQIGQYTTKQETILPINTNSTNTTNATTAATTTMNDSNFIDANQSLHDQLERKMKELTFSHPHPHPTSNTIPPPIQTNNINSDDRNNNRLVSPSNQMTSSFTPMMAPNHSL
ncbi:BRO1-like domain-containing protein [Cunninghamella echinulata]|nr:BRO1-like domain-containing protein [Cunninghamella echinulata]